MTFKVFFLVFSRLAERWSQNIFDYIFYNDVDFLKLDVSNNF